jgi:nucleoside-diphosphate-sugar epimerase
MPRQDAPILLAPTLGHDAYNVGWGRLTTAAEALETLRRLVPGFRFEFSPEVPSPWGPPRGPLDCARLRALGWTPRHDLESGLAAYLRGPDLSASS